MENKQQIC